MDINIKTKYNLGDIAFMRRKGYNIKTGKEIVLKAGPIKIIGIEVRVLKDGKVKVWYNCESANYYKFAFHAKGKNYVPEKALYTEQEINKLGYDQESVGMPEFYHPDGTHKTNEEIYNERMNARWNE